MDKTTLFLLMTAIMQVGVFISLFILVNYFRELKLKLERNNNLLEKEVVNIKDLLYTGLNSLEKYKEEINISFSYMKDKQDYIRERQDDTLADVINNKKVILKELKKLKKQLTETKKDTTNEITSSEIDDYISELEAETTSKKPAKGKK